MKITSNQWVPFNRDQFIAFSLADWKMNIYERKYTFIYLIKKWLS